MYLNTYEYEYKYILPRPVHLWWQLRCRKRVFSFEKDVKVYVLMDFINNLINTSLTMHLSHGE